MCAQPVKELLLIIPNRLSPNKLGQLTGFEGKVLQSILAEVNMITGKHVHEHSQFKAYADANLVSNVASVSINH